MPEQFLISLVNLGAAGLLIWFLWESGKRKDETIRARNEKIEGLHDKIEGLREKHAGELDGLRVAHEAETRGLREEVAERDRQRLRDSTEFGDILWQIFKAIEPTAEYTRRQVRGAGEDRSDDPRVGA